MKKNYFICIGRINGLKIRCPNETYGIILLSFATVVHDKSNTKDNSLNTKSLQNSIVC